MKNLFNKPIYVLMFAVVAPCFIFSVAYAQEGLEASSDSFAAQAAETEAYWTPERMAAAIPVPAPVVEMTEAQFDAEADAEPAGPPGMVEGTLPNQAFDPIPQTADVAPQYWGGSPGAGR